MTNLRLDHLVLTVRDLAATRRFYVDGLGMRWVEFGNGRHALGFADQKINLHLAGRELEPKAARPTPGAGDFCLLTTGDLADIEAGMAALDIPVIDGPAQRSGAVGPIVSIYFRDPDGNLVEVAKPVVQSQGIAP